MYTATLKNRLSESGKIRWVVEFTNGTDTFTDSFNDNKYIELQPRVARKLAELNFVDTFTIDGVINSTVPTVTPPTQADIDRNTWLADWRKLEIANKLVQAGVIVDTLPAYVTLKNKVVTDFKTNYINFLY